MIIETDLLYTYVKKDDWLKPAAKMINRYPLDQNIEEGANAPSLSEQVINQNTS